MGDGAPLAEAVVERSAPFDKSDAVQADRCRSLTNCYVCSHFGHDTVDRAASLSTQVARLAEMPLLNRCRLLRGDGLCGEGGAHLEAAPPCESVQAELSCHATTLSVGGFGELFCVLPDFDKDRRPVRCRLLRRDMVGAREQSLRAERSHFGWRGERENNLEKSRRAKLERRPRLLPILRRNVLRAGSVVENVVESAVVGGRCRCVCSELVN